MTLPEMALRFVLSNPTVSTTIVGMRKPEHVAANVSYSDKGPLACGPHRRACAITAGTASPRIGRTEHAR